ncbi:hypothetical protein G7Y89_g3269 [Cudoniella acicularis]|uniref:Uncharacterized protein n=1 Tax=Cudoniella acicularis TaxID=354080 RepID=A0A8H4RRQ2_9HELO|nr:hypothetical protein G7Y89_g3269 [Cudoniella acicularis]
MATGPSREVVPPGRAAEQRPNELGTLFNHDDEGYSSTNYMEHGDVDAGVEPQPPALQRYEKLAQKSPRLTDHLSITIGPPMIILFDIVVPCIIYYVWYNIHTSQWKNECRSFTSRREICPLSKPEFDEEILGYAVVSFGIGELYILIARVCRLLWHRDECAPLLSRSVWELDATSWVYGVAMICALIPFVIGSTQAIPELYLYSPGFLMVFLGIIMLVTLIPIPIPIGINSHARGTALRPFIYYAAEDFIAVDGLQDREFRVRYNARYDSSKGFRRMFLFLTLWWILGVCIYLGCLSAVIWTLEFHYAFGSSLGVLFAYILIWAVVSYFFVQFDMERQRKAYEIEKY